MKLERGFGGFFNNLIATNMKIKVYHLSRVKNRESINQKGLIPAKKDFGHIQYGPRIFISNNKEDLAFDFVDYEYVDCWEFVVDSSEIKKDPFSGSPNHFYIERAINSSELKLVASF
jgi:hypothetical protein